MINHKYYFTFILLLIIGLSACKSTKKASRKKAKQNTANQYPLRPKQRPKTVASPNTTTSKVDINNKKVGIIESTRPLPPKSVIVIERPENTTSNPNEKANADILAKKEVPKVKNESIPPFPTDQPPPKPIVNRPKPKPPVNKPKPIAPPPPVPQPMATVKAPAPLEKSENIEKAQILLYLAGFKTGRIDGTLKPETIEAITQYQRSKRIPDGDRSQKTLNALGVPLMDFSIEDIQQALEDKGYNPGPIDNLVGPKTKAALKAFLQKNKLPLVGLNQQVKTALFSKDPKYVIRKKTTVDPLFTETAPVASDPLFDLPFRGVDMNSASVRQVQQALLAHGYDPGPPSEVLTPQMEDALYHYQVDKQLPMGGLNEDTLMSLGFRGR